MGKSVVMEAIIEKINDNRITLQALNCGLFPAVPVRCGNQQCKKSHKIVLATDQVEIFGKALRENKDTLVGGKKYIRDSNIRKNMQIVLENFKTAACSESAFEHIVINPQAHPGPHSTDYKHDHHNEYKDSYIRQATAIRNRPDTKNCVYVRADGTSGYPDFEANIRSQSVTVTPCDEFQGV